MGCHDQSDDGSDMKPSKRASARGALSIITSVFLAGWTVGVRPLLAQDTKPATTTMPVGPHITDWMYKGKIGLSTHYIADNPQTLEKTATQFQVDKVAGQAAEAGTAWFLFTIHHQSWMMMAPNATYDRILKTSERTAERDIPLELHRALQPKGLKLMLYVNLRLDPRSICPAGVREAMGGWPPNKTLIDNIVAVYKEFSLRYGDKAAGWWVDGVWLKEYKDAPQREEWFTAIANALRAGNPNALVAFNPGVGQMICYSGQNDYVAGESNDLSVLPMGRWLDGAQWHVWTYMGGWWSSGGLRFTDQQIRDYAVQVIKKGGVLTFEVGTQGVSRAGYNGAITKSPYNGYIDPDQVRQIRKVSEAVRCARQ